MYVEKSLLHKVDNIFLAECDSIAASTCVTAGTLARMSEAEIFACLWSPPCQRPRKNLKPGMTLVEEVVLCTGLTKIL